MQDSFTSSCDIVEDITLLLPKGCHDSQQALSKLTTCATLGAKAALAPEHDGTEGPVELSEGIAPPAGLQNRAYHFHGTRLLS
jgi:hypothetical protein